MKARAERFGGEAKGKAAGGGAAAKKPVAPAAAVKPVVELSAEEKARRDARAKRFAPIVTEAAPAAVEPAV